MRNKRLKVGPLIYLIHLKYNSYVLLCACVLLVQNKRGALQLEGVFKWFC